MVSGTHVVASYLGGEGDLEHKIRVGPDTWHRTGDAGWLDASGRLWLGGRCAARIEDSHGRRYPLAVDAALSDNAALSRATLIRHRDSVLLVVEARGPSDEEMLAAIGRDIEWAGADQVVAIRRFPLDRATTRDLLSAAATHAGRGALVDARTNHRNHGGPRRIAMSESY